MIEKPRLYFVCGQWAVTTRNPHPGLSNEYHQAFSQAQRHAYRLNMWIRAGRIAGLAGSLRCPDGTTHIGVGTLYDPKDTRSISFYRWDRYLQTMENAHYGWFHWHQGQWWRDESTFDRLKQLRQL